MSASVPVADITACDEEPIHIPGSIQPHGLLLVADPATGQVLHVAGNVEERLGSANPVGSDLASLVGAGAAAKAVALGGSGSAPAAFIGQIETAAGELLDIGAFVEGGLVCLELEPAARQTEGSLAMLSRLENAASSFEQASSLQSLCERAAAAFCEATRFDRVMIYRFGDNGNGEVLAEARAPDAHSFLHHHFPASDIPKQARALYVRNLTRVIPDAAYEPAPLRPAWSGAKPFDMSDSGLRSVSPIHLQYLRNMGVAASASVSIVRDGSLWGLVACHNETPKLLTYDARAACRALAGSLSRQIRARDEADAYRARIRFRGSEDAMVDLLSREGDLDSAMSHHLPELIKMMDADGAAVLRGDDLVAGGHHPPEADMRALAGWLLQRPGDSVLASSTLADIYPPAASFREVGSGILSAVLSVDEPWLVVWFRAEQAEVVKWAGNPHKAVMSAPGQPLSPRASFEAWRETVRGRSRRWIAPEVETARRIRTTLLEMRQSRRLQDLNGRLTRLLQDQIRLVEQKDFLIGEVNHRVQNSLQLVSSFLQLQSRAADSADARTTLEEARHRIAAVGLVHRRLYAGDETRNVDGARYVEELCTDTLAAMGREWVANVAMDLSPVLIATDRAVTLGLVLTELFININKYAYGGNPGPIEVRLSEEREMFTLIVADRGVGKASTRRGFGSRMIDGLVAQMGGRIMQEDNQPGLRVILSAPAMV